VLLDAYYSTKLFPCQGFFSFYVVFVVFFWFAYIIYNMFHILYFIFGIALIDSACVYIVGTRFSEYRSITVMICKHRTHVWNEYTELYEQKI